MQSSLMKQKGFSLLELILVTVVIGILMASGLKYYQGYIENAQRVALETQARNFQSVLYLAKAQWFIAQAKGEVPRKVSLDNVRVSLNDRGWVYAGGDAKGGQYKAKSPWQCLGLWNTVFQNPPPATMNASHRGDQKYHISVSGGRCRFELVTNDSASHYFEYSMADGGIKITVPPKD